MGRHEGNAGAPEHESSAEDVAGQDLAVQAGLLFEKFECCGSDATVLIRDCHVREDRRNGG